jgi:hypothetical protein
MNEQKYFSENRAAARKDAIKVVRIYDPAMCCSSGVCGPRVDPGLAQFASTLQFIGKQDGVTVERYNLGQQPQAFVANDQVKRLLADGGDKRLPFIFINDELAFTTRYPSRDELLQAVGIESGKALSLDMAPQPADPCCGEKGCC